MAYGQFATSCGAPAPSVAQGRAPNSYDAQDGWIAPATGLRSFSLVPSLCVSERYDSNVFFSRPRPGLQKEDYVTSVNPMVRINHNGDHAAGTFDIEGISETYVNNSGLNFLGSNGRMFLNFDNTVKKLLPNAGLFITDAVSYLPIPPGFVNPVAGTSPSAPANIQDIFARGILFSRTNRITNSGTVLGTYDISSITRINASYSHSMLRFLSSRSSTPGTVPVNLFNTTAQTGTVGGSTQVSHIDRLNIAYSHTRTDFENDFAPSFSFKTNIVTVGWSRALTSNITAEVGGGGIFIDPGLTTYAANGSLAMNLGNTRATLSYARSAFPSFSGVPTQVVGHVVSLSAVQQISQQWVLSGTANYSTSSGTTGRNAIKFDSIGGSVNLAYLITGTWSAALSYNYIRYDREFGTIRDQFDRHAAVLSVRATWE